MDYYGRAVQTHREHKGKWELRPLMPLKTSDDLSLAYTPGVAAVSDAIAKEPEQAYNLTRKCNTVAILSDGSAVLGLGNIGPCGALPVMEGKAVLFKEFADIDGVPLVVDAHSAADIIAVAKAVAPSFGGINLEDIAAPKCFEVEEALQDIGIPVFHDDQHGTAVVLLAALINACKLTGKKITDLNVVINGAGAAGTAIAKLLKCVGQSPDVCESVRHVYICDSKGVISPGRQDLNPAKARLLEYSNADHKSGTVYDALVGADVFIGVSKGDLLTEAHIRSMAPQPMIFAMANPVPEIMPDRALAAGAAVVGTGRSDLPNQVNNVLAYPGIFRGALDARAVRITEGMKIAAAYALASTVEAPTADRILPAPLDHGVAPVVAAAVREAAAREAAERRNAGTH
ncbi:MAG: NAD(P)-dependent malic enzyme [Polyangiales bacterium]